MIYADDFQNWKESHVTKQFFSDVQSAMDCSLSNVLDGNTLGEDCAGTASRTERMVGFAQGLSSLISWKPEIADKQLDDAGA